MIKQMRKAKSQGGFSLVELMVVVAIIGALAMVAIPRVNRFIAKARTSEAQINLSSIYTFNKNFFVEFTGYTSSLPAMGYQPEGDVRYNVGWAGAAVCPANFITLRTAAACVDRTDTIEECPASGTCTVLNGNDGAAPPAVVGSVQPAAPNFAAFTAGAIASIGQGAATDQWTIDQDKSLRQVQDGTL